MKKILFATTALVATSGVAAADVAITGFAEIGVLGGDAYATEQFHTDIDVTFTMTGEADNGLTFGAAIDLDETDDGDAFGNTTQGGETYFIAFGGARLSMGDVDGAYDAALTDVAIGGSIADDHTTHTGFSGTAGLDGSYDGQIATFSYAFSGFTGYISAEVDDAGAFDPIWGVGAAYSADLGGVTLGVGLGYQSGDKNNSRASIVATANALADAVDAGDPFSLDLALSEAAHEAYEAWGISLNTTLSNGIQLIAVYEEAKFEGVSVTSRASEPNNTFAAGTTVFGVVDETQTHWGLGVGYTMNALTLGVNYGEYDNRFGLTDLEQKGWGLAVNYDLGGGLEAQFGYGDSETSHPVFGSVDTDQYSLGLAMSF